MRTCGSGSASKTSTMFFGGITYLGGSDADGTCAMSAGAARQRAMTMNRKGRAASMDPLLINTVAFGFSRTYSRSGL